MGLTDRLPPPPRDTDFRSGLRGPAVAARVGTVLSICFAIAFVTGVWSHYAQSTPGWLTMPTRPVNFYRITQGLHIIAGSACVPLLLVKLWSVYPRLFQAVPTRPSREAVLHLLERLSVAVLMASVIFQLVTGLANSSQWYPWAFSFRSAHFAVAWVAIGAILLHIAVKLPLIRQAWSEPVETTALGEPTEAAANRGPISRRTLLRTTWAAAGLAVLATAGASVPWLRTVSFFAVRTGDGPQGVPINRTAATAGVTTDMVGDGWRLELVRGDQSEQLTLDDLRGMPQATESLPIACVEGWSAGATWTGVRIRDLVARAGGDPDDPGDIVVTSLQQRYAFGVTTLQSNFAADDKTLLALQLHGEDLELDHGYPARLIAANRPGVLQTKWVTRMELAT